MWRLKQLLITIVLWQLKFFWLVIKKQFWGATKKNSNNDQIVFGQELKFSITKSMIEIKPWSIGRLNFFRWWPNVFFSHCPKNSNVKIRNLPSLTIKIFQSPDLTIETWQLKFFGQRQIFFSRWINGRCQLDD